MKVWWKNHSILLVTVLALGGCTQDEGPLGLERVDEESLVVAQAVLTCQVDLRGAAMSCASPEASTPAGVAGAILGGQGIYVLLESSNVGYSSATTTFSADVVIENRLMQALGTADGETLHAEGVRIFFLNEPEVTAGTGAVTVANRDGEATFIDSDRPFFQYDELLGPGQRSAPKTWEWNVPATVEGFSFQVGVSAAVPDETAVVPGIGLDASTFAAGLSHTCGFSYRGEIYCWGDGSKGQFGNGKEHGDDGSSSLVPVKTPWSGEPFASLSTFADQICALTVGGKAYCWGDAEDGGHGDGSGTKRSSIPLEVAAGEVRFRSIAVGGSFNCAVSTNAEAFCWGNGEDGALGNGTTEFANTPVQVTSAEAFASIGAGMVHVCALNTAGQAFCWGSNEDGQLGNDSWDDSLVPVAVQSTETFVSLSVGGLHACALTGTGEIYCWGHGQYGQMGDGQPYGSLIPVKVAWSGDPFIAVSAGGAHTCAVTATGGVYCWGSGAVGQLGNGESVDVGELEGLPPTTPADKASPSPISWPSGEPFSSVSAGIFHTCATTESMQTYCWGLGLVGQLGNGSTENKSLPTLADTRLGIN